MAHSYLIIKHGALGDVIQGLDAFESLRASFPSAKLTLLTTDSIFKLLCVELSLSQKPVWAKERLESNNGRNGQRLQRNNIFKRETLNHDQI